LIRVLGSTIFRAQYIIKLPKAERDADEWQTAMQALTLVAEQDGPASSHGLA
jgi:hypothetical protein